MKDDSVYDLQVNEPSCLKMVVMSWQVQQRAAALSRKQRESESRFPSLPHTSSSSSLRQCLSSADRWAHITFTLTLTPGSGHKERQHHHESTRRRTTTGLGLPS
jgi:hypothetical protein